MYARLLTPQVWIFKLVKRRSDDPGVYSLYLPVGSVVDWLGRKPIRMKDGTVENRDVFQLQPFGFHVVASADCDIEAVHTKQQATRPVDSRHVTNVLGQPVKERNRESRRKAK